MDIPSLIQLMQNKVTILSNAKALAFSSGDLDRMNAIENDFLGTQNTLSQLQMLLDATRAANISNLDLSSVVTAGVQSAQNTSAIPKNPTAVLSDYDISTYAADSQYLQKITDMLMYIPNLDATSQVDMYIDREVVGSPITGQMVIDAATKYAVDTRLLVAIMELDSRLGTAGTGAATFNPGNVGNTGTVITTYGSWTDGVAAVAYWLSKHRSGIPTPVTTAPDNTNIPAVVPPVVEPVVIAPDPNHTNVATSTPVFIPPIVPVPTPVTVVSTSTSPVALTVMASSTDAVGTTTITTTIATPTATSTSTEIAPFDITGTASTSPSTSDTSFINPDLTNTNSTTTNPTATSTPITSVESGSNGGTTDSSVATSTTATSTSTDSTSQEAGDR